jgi:hypothetical protein
MEKRDERWNVRVNLELSNIRYEGDLHQTGPYKSKEEAEVDIDALYADVEFGGLLLWNGNYHRSRSRIGKHLVDSGVLTFFAVYEK